MTLESRAWNIARAAALLLVLVSTRIVYWQMVRGDELLPVALSPAKAAIQYDKIAKIRREDTQAAVQALADPRAALNLEDLPQPVVQRTTDLLESISRGSIYDRNGRLLATEQENQDGERFRFYTEPSLAHVIGYVSGLRTGVTGLELSYNQTLLGLDRPEAQVEQMLHQPISGSDLILTIDSAVQRAADSALRGRAGAIVVLEAGSGAVLAMASAPRFDPNRILDAAYVEELVSACQGAPECQGPFLNRATQALYTPGSTWKTVTLAAALDTGQVTPGTVFDFGEPVQGAGGPYFVYEVDGGTIPDPNHREDRLNLEQSYAKSANAAFARIGDEMPADTLIDYAARFGFSAAESDPFALEIESSPAQLAADVDSLYENNLLRAVTAIGQGELLASPLNMAIVALSVLNEGDLPVPYLVQGVRSDGGEVVEDLPNRRVIEGVMKPETAQLVRQMMVAVVEEGSGRQAGAEGLVTGGKTGTAQVGGDRPPHSWFVGFAEGEGRAVVIAVLIENGGEGSQTAAPIFAEIAQAALREAGAEVEEIVPTPTPAAEATAAATPEAEQPLETEAPEGTQPAAAAPSATPDGEPAGTPAASATPTLAAAGQVPPPDIPRDPKKGDLTAANPSCANQREVPPATGGFIWPSPYQGLSGDDFREGHPGIDLSTPTGTPVYAADTGLVIFAGWTGIGYGNAVLIDHGNGYQTLYAHLSQVSTYCGASAEQGKLIGLSGNSGNSSGPHLHFEVRVPGGYLNPLSVLPLP